MRLFRTQVGVLPLLALLVLWSDRAQALNEDKSVHYSADKQVWDRQKNQIELFGHAVVNQSGEVLTSDYMIYDQVARTLYARGDAVYIAGNTVIRGDEMHFNLDSRTGSVTAGRVSGENFTLAGERINKLGDTRYQTHWGEYSTCRDCPQTWTFTAEDVDMEVEGYAKMSNIVTKFKDAPAVWIPYLIVPMKTKRQTGLLFPTFGWFDVDGFKYVQPFFWAINRWSDMTIGLGRWSNRGTRAEWQGRYQLRDGSMTSNFTYLQDDIFNRTSSDTTVKEAYLKQNPGRISTRWSIEVQQDHLLPFGISEKLKFSEVSDINVPNSLKDLPQFQKEPVIPSILLFSKSAPELSGYIAMKRYRNLMSTDTDVVNRYTRFDPTTVQVYPSAALTTNSKLILGTPIASGLSVGINNFTRGAGPFDYEYDSSRGTQGTVPPAGWTPRPGVDPVREATRFSLTPELYTSFRLGDVFKVVPSARYYGYFYDFHRAMPDLQRGYLLAQTELSTQFEKVYDWDDPEITKLKHLIRPKLTYSVIPVVNEDKSHPFIQQIDRLPGNNFDNNDIVPLSASQMSAGNSNYFYPLGNSLSYGLTTQLIRKEGEVGEDIVEPKTNYRKIIELSLGQAYDFRENYSPTSFDKKPRPISRAFAEVVTSWPKIETYTLGYWYPYISGTRYTVNHDIKYIHESAKRNRVFLYERSISARYTYSELGCRDNAGCLGNATHNLNGKIKFSLNDYFMPTFEGSYNLYNRKFVSWQLNFQIQSPAQCWQFILQIPYDRTKGLGYQFDLSLNISGQGFGGFTQAAETGMSSSSGGFGTQ